MDKMKKMIPLKDLNLTSRFLFDEVLEDSQTHQAVLSIILGRKIPLMDEHRTEKELRVSPLLRSIRMDVFSMDEDFVIYNTEMQQEKKGDLAKRSRYYQSMIDTSLLEVGVPNYNLLNTVIIIMIMTFDLFGYERYMYTFSAKCEEEPECSLEDGATRIFLNTRGKNNHGISEELKAFLHYLEHTTDAAAAETDSELIKQIHRRVREVKASEEAGVRYMQAWEEKYYEREKGREEGLEKGREEGLEKGREQGIKALVIDYIEEGYNKERILEKLRIRFVLSEEDAERYFRQFCPEEK